MNARAAAAVGQRGTRERRISTATQGIGQLMESERELERLLSVSVSRSLGAPADPTRSARAALAAAFIKLNTPFQLY